jgi:hypothetical protein
LDTIPIKGVVLARLFFALKRDWVSGKGTSKIAKSTWRLKIKGKRFNLINII